MAWYDLSGDALRSHVTTTQAPKDLRRFWDGQLAAAAAASTPPDIEPYQPDLYRTFDAYDVRFSGAYGHPINAWLLRPRTAEPAPVLVKYLGWGDGRGVPADHTYWPAAGFTVLLVDSRGQGGIWSPGGTGDPTGDDAAPEVPGILTRGVCSPETYYYTRLWVDAACAVLSVPLLAEQVDGIDTTWIGVTGGSQGGGMALAAAALTGDAVHWVQAEMPFIAEPARAMTMVDTRPYRELARYLALYPEHEESVRRTLSYVDVTVLAPWITAPAVMTVGLMDDVCPPSTAYATFNALGSSEKRIEEFAFAGHETPPPWQEGRIRSAHAALAAARSGTR